MCGLCGIIVLRNRHPELRDRIQTLTKSLEHRGPNGTKTWNPPQTNIAIGHTRLSVLDTSSRADQPMHSSDGRFTIAYNGEVYNFIEVARELEKIGTTFVTNSDTEVVLKAYIEWGAAAFSKFNGMWAVAIYDSLKKIIILCRDRFGVKPLYLFRTNDLIAFASEVKSIHKTFPQEVSPNWDYLTKLIDFELDAYSSDESYLNEVKPIHPGTLVEISTETGKQYEKTWYHLEEKRVPRTYREQVEAFRELLNDSCKIRLRSDVPVATCLSGGIDSGSIVSILSTFKNPENQRFGHFTHTAFNASFPNSAQDEVELAKQLTEDRATNLKIKTITTPTANSLLEAMKACDGPMPTLAFYPIWLLYKHIKDSGISVTLDGQGADEMLGGYFIGKQALQGAIDNKNLPYFFDLYKTYSAVQPEAGRLMLSYTNSIINNLGLQLQRAIKLPFKNILGKTGIFPPNQLGQTIDRSKVIFSKKRDTLNDTLLQQFFRQPLPYYLYQYDRCSMANGVECRMPFMDYRLVEFTFSLPLQSRIGMGYTKRILRDSVKDILPDYIRKKRLKIGFNAPYQDWLRGPLREWMNDTISSHHFKHLPKTDTNVFKNALEKNDQSLTAEWSLWARLHITSWLHST